LGAVIAIVIALYQQYRYIYDLLRRFLLFNKLYMKKNLRFHKNTYVFKDKCLPSIIVQSKISSFEGKIQL